MRSNVVTWAWRLAGALRLRRPAVLVVCQGNTCRSPMLAGALREQTHGRWVVTSAGLGAQTGAGATPEAVIVARRHGIDISDHQSTPFRLVDLTRIDRVIAVTPEIAMRIRGLGVPEARILFASVPDPFGGDLRTYEMTFRDLVTIAHDLITKGGI